MRKLDSNTVEITLAEQKAAKWFDLGMVSGTKNTVICINEELELLRKVKAIKTKKQLIDHMQKFNSKLVKR